MVNSYETSTCLVQENASWLEEPHGQGQATEASIHLSLHDVSDDACYDLLDDRQANIYLKLCTYDT